MGSFDMWAGSMFLLEDLRPKNMTGGGLANVTAMALSLEKEKCEKDEERRTKQINYGYATKEYQYYIKTVPKKNRKKGDPQTPDKNTAANVSRRRWDGRVRSWRKALHVWYDSQSHASSSTDGSLSASSCASGLYSDGRLSLSPDEMAQQADLFAAMNLQGSKKQNGEDRLVASRSEPTDRSPTADIYAGMYYQILIQQNLILGWLFHQTNNPEFGAMCELLQQFFTQQALVLQSFGIDLNGQQN